MSIIDLADRVHLTKTPCSERDKRLERDGIISRYSASIDPVEADMGHVMIVHVNLSKTSDMTQFPELLGKDQQTTLGHANPFLCRHGDGEGNQHDRDEPLTKTWQRASRQSQWTPCRSWDSPAMTPRSSASPRIRPISG